MPEFDISKAPNGIFRSFSLQPGLLGQYMIFMADNQMSTETLSPAQPAHAFPTESALQRAHEKNSSAQETIEHSAQELVVINTVLRQEVPNHAQNSDVAQALKNSDALEERLEQSADDLAEVNQALKQEITERAELERELVETKAALAEAVVGGDAARP